MLQLWVPPKQSASHGKPEVASWYTFHMTLKYGLRKDWVMPFYTAANSYTRLCAFYTCIKYTRLMLFYMPLNLLEIIVPHAFFKPHSEKSYTSQQYKKGIGQKTCHQNTTIKKYTRLNPGVPVYIYQKRLFLSYYFLTATMKTVINNGISQNNFK